MGIEFNSIRSLKENNLPSVLYNVIPEVNTDNSAYYLYSAYESINVSPEQLGQDIDTIRSILRSSGRDFNKLLIGEYGFDEKVVSDIKSSFNRTTEIIKNKNIPIAIWWNLLNTPTSFGIFNSVIGSSGYPDYTQVGLEFVKEVNL